MATDREMARMNAEWKEKLRRVENSVNEWQARWEHERQHSEIVREKLRRTEKELHRILQKKYDIVQVRMAGVLGQDGDGWALFTMAVLLPACRRQAAKREERAR